MRLEFRTEQEFRRYLDDAIKEGERSTPQYPLCEKMLEAYLFIY